MTDVHVAEELWSTGMLPEGILERWFVADGTQVRVGEALHDDPRRQLPAAREASQRPSAKGGRGPLT